MANKIDDIDIVVLWVDGGDREWLKVKRRHSVSDLSIDDSVNRYRNWDNLQFLFRGIEQFTPWVRMVHFVTWGHLPTWLDTTNKRLNIVKHEDFIPKKYLPTFSARPIEMNLHRIKGLASKFILFNDDMFVVRPLKSSFFFSKEGLPREQAAPATLNSFDINDPIPHTVINNNAIINQEFSPSQTPLRTWLKLFSFQNGLEAIARSIFLLPFSLHAIQIPDTPHMPSAFLRSTFEEVWSKYPDVLERTSKSRFRSATDVNQYLIKQWQVQSGCFEPLSIHKSSVYVSHFPNDLAKLKKALISKRCKIVCINDWKVDGDFDEIKGRVNRILGQRLPNKSEFELNV